MTHYSFACTPVYYNIVYIKRKTYIYIYIYILYYIYHIHVDINSPSQFLYNKERL
jgi:hypothetical protein